MRFLSSEWIVSILAHALLFAFLALGLAHRLPPAENAGLSLIIENPQLAPRAARPARAKPLEKHPPKPVKERISDSASLPVPVTPPKTPGQVGPPTGVQGEGEGMPTAAAEFLVTEMPVLVSEVRIPFPPAARKRGAQGKVVMNLLIDDSGKVRRATLIEGPDPDLNVAALAAIRDFKFKPARVNERRVAVQIRYIYNFVMEH